MKKLLYSGKLSLLMIPVGIVLTVWSHLDGGLIPTKVLALGTLAVIVSYFLFKASNKG